MVYCLFLIVYNLCGAFFISSIELQHSLGDAAVLESTFISMILFVQMACDWTFTIQKSHFGRMGHLYDIEFSD